MNRDSPSAPPINPLGADRCRTRDLPGVGRVEIPRHIIRVETGSTHGWQVRFEKPSKFFSDPRGMERRPAALSSLEQAKAHLKAVWRPRTKSRITRIGPGKAGNPVPGVWVEAREQAAGTFWYVICSHPDGVTHRKFYVGSRSTYTPARLELAEARALEQRRAWLEAYVPPLR